MDKLNQDGVGGLGSNTLKYDLTAGLVVFLVALPLCLGIAMASGAPLFAGIITGIVGGIVVGLLSGAPLGVSGPAAGLTVIVLTAIETLGAYEAFLVAVVLAGFLQIVAGYAKAGIIGYYFPNSVIKGMLAGIGLILILKQIPHAFGYDADFEGDMSFYQPDGENTFSEVFRSINYISLGATIISLLSLAILIFWERPFLKKFGFFRLVPGALVVVVLGIVLNTIFQAYFPALALAGNHLVSLPVPESIPDFLSKFTLPDFSHLTNPDVYTVAFTLAIVASLETLLSVEAVDKLDPYKRVTPTNRELRAQGVGNMIAGLIGGLPLTQVIVRSTANVSSGGKTKKSAIIHGFFLLISVVAVPRLLNQIPLASLAAVLLMIGYKLAKVSLFQGMYRLGWAQFLPFVVTIVAILLTDLLRGIAFGMVVAFFYILKNNYKTSYFFRQEKSPHGEKTVLELSENTTFLNKGNILSTLNKLPENSYVVVDGTRAVDIDPDVVEILHDFYSTTAPRKNIRVEIVGVDGFKEDIVSPTSKSLEPEITPAHQD
ncbi:SulP family inorganic anion transporter [soil metagenome]